MVRLKVQRNRQKTEDRALTVSVVVPTRDRNADLERCLEAISRLDPPPMEVVVVDSAPCGKGAQEIALQWHARYILEKVPGASRARNRGAREARGDVVFYTDDDAVPDISWLSSTLGEFSDNRVALVVSRTVPPETEPGLGPLYELCGFSGQSNDRVVVDHETPEWFQKVNFQPFGIGPNLAIRRSVFQRWGGFDERLGPGTPVPGHEEQHAFLQLIELGFKLVYVPTARVAHPLHKGSAEELRERSLCRMRASSAYLTLLVVEKPRVWGRIMTYIVRRVFGTVNPHGSSHAIQISRLKCFLARLQGPELYFKSRKQHRVRAADELALR